MLSALIGMLFPLAFVGSNAPASSDPRASGQPASKIPRWAKKPKKLARDNNRANQKNPNHEQYKKSRGQPTLKGQRKQAFVDKKARQRKNEGHFIRNADLLTPTDRLNKPAFNSFVGKLRKEVPGANLKKTGSRRKKTAIHGADWDYHIETRDPMTIEQRDALQVKCKKAFTLEPKSGASIDFFPPNAEWHDKDVQVQKPGSVQFDKGGKNAVKMLKKEFPDKSGHELEQLVLTIQSEKGWKDRSGMSRFQEAQRRLRTDLC